MHGSTLVYEMQKKRLTRLAKDPDAIEDLGHIALDVLTTLDFERLCGKAKVTWSSGGIGVA